MKALLAPLALLALAASAAAPEAPDAARGEGDARAGQAVFSSAKCVTCHGKDGKGSAAIAKLFKVARPERMNLVSDSVRGSTPEKLVAIVTEGVVTDGRERMKGFKSKLTASQIEDVVAYVRFLNGQGSAAAARQKRGDLGLGQALYDSAKCVTCHGRDGKGNPAAARMFKVDPARLSLVGPVERTPEQLVAIITDGIVTDGRERMKAFKGRLTGAEIANVAAYVRSLRGEGRDAAPK